MLFPDPGPCPVDDAPHTTCTVDAHGALVVPILGASVTPTVTVRIEPTGSIPPLRADQTLPPGHVTTATYRGRKARP